MQYKIPQNVQLADKIVGPLTLKQLIIMAVGGGLTYAVYTILASRYFIEVWIGPTAILGLSTLAFTFLKIQGIPFGKWLILLVEYFFLPRRRTFQLGAAERHLSLFEKKSEKQPVLAPKKDKSIEDLSEITKVLDSYGQTPTHAQ